MRAAERRQAEGRCGRLRCGTVPAGQAMPPHTRPARGSFGSAMVLSIGTGFGFAAHHWPPGSRSIRVMRARSS